MMAWITAKLSSAWVVVAGVAVALVAAASIVLKLLSAGRAQERAATNARIINNVEKRNEIEMDVARERDPAGKLQRWTRD